MKLPSISLRDTSRTPLAGLFWAVLLIAIIDDGAVSGEIRMVLAAVVFSLLPVSALVLGLPAYSGSAILAACLVPFAVMLYVFAQTTPLAGLIQPDPAWQDVAAVAVVSATPADDRVSLLSMALPFGIFLWGLVLFDDDRRADAALRRLAVGGGLIAFWSLLQFTLAPDTLGFGVKTHYLDSLTGFFVNRNTAATFFGVIALVLAAVLWSTLSTISGERLKLLLIEGVPLPRTQRKELHKATLYGFLCAAAFAALMLTRSRAGITASFAGATLLVALMALLPPSGKTGGGRENWPWRRMALALFAAVAVAVVFSLFAGQAILRMQYDVRGDGRFCVMPAVTATIRDALPWGAGLSGFANAYAPHADPDCGIDTVLVRAHNVFAEGLITLGLLFPLLALAVIGSLLKIFLHGLSNRRRYRYVGNLGLAALLTVILHSIFDFSLQIPGFAMSFAAILAPITTLCLRPSARNADSSEHQR